MPVINKELYSRSRKIEAQRQRSRVSTSQMAEQLDMLERYKAYKLAADALGLDWNYSPGNVRAEMDERMETALWVMEVTQQQFDHTDLIDTQECARC